MDQAAMKGFVVLVNGHSQIPAGLERRVEDYTVITGRSSYVDDIRLNDERPSILHMGVVRSTYAHARILAIHLDEARAMEGVIAAFAGDEVANDLPAMEVMAMPDVQKPQRHPLAVKKVRYVGDPVAVVLAESQYIARDACDRIRVDYEPLPVVLDVEQASKADAPLLYEELGTNVLYRKPNRGGEIDKIFAQAEHTVTLRLENQRLAPTSMEPRTCMFDYDAESGYLTAYVSSQNIFQMRSTLAHFLDMAEDHVRVHNADVGGAFGSKTLFLGEEIIAAVLAKKYARPVKWVEDRSENLEAHMHGRGQVNYVEAAYTSQGELRGLRVHTLGDVGAFIYGIGHMLPMFTSNMLSGAYHVRAIDCDIAAVLTNKVPTGAYRGAGRPEAAYIMERTIERIARELGLDPVEVRRRNLLQPDEFPYHAPTGMVYDSGNYQRTLDKALALADYAGWREKQRQQREQDSSKLLGIAVSTFIETSGTPTPPGNKKEAATVRILSDGTILVQSAVATNGQGHFTAFSQIAAQVFHVPGTQVKVALNDTSLPAFGTGTNASRTTLTAGSTIYLAAEAAREKVLQLAAYVLEAAKDDLSIENGRVFVSGVPARSVELGELARMAEERPDLIEHEDSNPANGVPIEGLAAWRDFAPPYSAVGSGTHIAVVEVERETGEIEVLHYVAVDDAGRILNHYLAEAQMHGSITQGIGQALFEGVEYDQQGHDLTDTLMKYPIPKARQVPDYELELVETLSPISPLGSKGLGEAGTIAAPPTVVNAVIDALSPLGVKTLDMPLKPEKIWRVIQAAQQGTLRQDEPVLPVFFKQPLPQS
jgi:aerobic carbon-monoxide dehydrogenase large subunit